jgi:hypothetical protein
MTKPAAKKVADNLVDSITQTEVKNVAIGKGLKHPFEKRADPKNSDAYAMAAMAVLINKIE